MINNTLDVVVMSCSVFTARDGTHVILSCPDGPSRRLYAKLLRQLEDIDDLTFKTVLNNVLAISVDTLLLPLTFEMNETEAQNVRSAAGRASLSRKGGQVFDLQDKSVAVAFV